MICVKIDAFKVDWGCIPFKNKSNFNPLHLQWLRCREKGRLQDLFIIGGGGGDWRVPIDGIDGEHTEKNIIHL